MDEPINQHLNVVFQSDYDIVVNCINITVKAIIGHLSQSSASASEERKNKIYIL